MNKLILATEQGIVICEREGKDWHESARGPDRSACHKRHCP